jgi:hypothetical protein
MLHIILSLPVHVLQLPVKLINKIYLQFKVRSMAAVLFIYIQIHIIY